MNAKTCKALRATARARTIGMPARQLIRSKQITTRRRYAECAVNNPETTRGVYRELKSGRRINSKMFVTPEDAARREAVLKPDPREVEADGAQHYARGGPKPDIGFIARVKEKTRLFFRRFGSRSQ